MMTVTPSLRGLWSAAACCRFLFLRACSQANVVKQGPKHGQQAAALQSASRHQHFPGDSRRRAGLVARLPVANKP